MEIYLQRYGPLDVEIQIPDPATIISVNLAAFVKQICAVNQTACLLLVSILLLSGCSTHLVSLDYQGDPKPNKMITSGIGEIVVADNRGTDEDWLDAM